MCIISAFPFEFIDIQYERLESSNMKPGLMLYL